MKLVRLDPITFQTVDLIEEWQSLIWTERFTDAGDFTLVTADIQNTMTALPLDGLVSLMDTDEVCFIDSHEIKRDKDGTRLLTVKGQSFETILDDRCGLDDIHTTVMPKTWQVGANYAAAAIQYVVNQHIVSGIMYPQDALPDTRMYIASSAIPSPIDPGTWPLGIGSLYSNILKMAKDANLGFRNTKAFTETSDPDMRIYIDGYTDKSTEQSVRERVIFNVSAGHFNDATYLFTNRGYKNIAYVFAPIGNWSISRKGVGITSGFNRHVLTVDASDISKVDAGTTYDELLRRRGQLEMQKYNKTRLFEGTVSNTASLVYKTNYFLGDLVTIQAEYGVEEKVLVSEYIRSQDENGETGFPTLSQLNVEV